MSIVVAILIGTIALAVVGLVSYLAHAAIAGRIAEGNAKAEAAELRGTLKVAAKNIDIANDATKTAVDAEKQQEARGNDLEKELVDADHPATGGGLAGLSSLSEATGVSDRRL